MTDYTSANQKAWDKQAESQLAWSKPVDSKTIHDAKQGKWQVHLTPTPVDAAWLGDIKDKKILCLASAGGQQAPVLAAAGANVTVFDFSQKQLEQDKMVAERDDLTLEIVQGDMRSLHMFADATFDIIFHPISNLYIPDVNPVWQECHRVLKTNGRLLSSFYNPILFIGKRDKHYDEQGIIKPSYTMPYSELSTLSAEQIAQKQERQEAFVFGHSLTDLIGGQIKAGFSITGFKEDWQPNPRFVIDNYLPTFLTTMAIKTN
ncbi:class I SAM-dependent methyltransferase [Providencia huaxiensis]|uniref:Class I SAM-dependent methyltransferase n=1 Tax=Providencia huaxiensis TaxID=2027290 RepID=A0ABU2IWT1_9GAMM|nr:MULTISPECIES: class I SAM-dependent methyltransferase [Providencia]MBZ3680785.1 class I SAM-dependent methyltransferase [Providencia rettgeri]AXH61206.1 class I SAM-dependent methyltransferase [Providencia huaxiensis]MCG9534359.1 class I SAM-dependent methyltransferase [Providencia huaxiensis]MDT0133528.1 class I SAM-dependent methyltransferase [Providencia huaxiensis]MDT1979934.1 class I SAM-dependent methyltransferase [Providencia huaxiensis]